MKAGVRAASSIAFLLAWPSFAAPHDIPTEVVVQAFLKPEASRLHLLVRAPLRALRDVDYPQRGPGYLDIARAGPALHQALALWIADDLELFEDDARLGAPRIVAARVALPSAASFSSYQAALEQLLRPPLPDTTQIVWSQALLDAQLDYEIRSERSRFSIRPRLGRLGERVLIVLRFLPPGGALRAFELAGEPGLVRLDPRFHQAVLRFVELGFLHILGGADHLLFLLCLVIPLRRLRPLVLVVTSFTLAHSITLIASAFEAAPGALWFPPLVETLIATSIVYMALENMVASSTAHRFVLSFAFGLVHGFGFSFALRETLQFAGSHLLTALLSFNVGVELGQLLVLVLLVPARDLLFRLVSADRPLTIVLSALAAHTGWHWLSERAGRLAQFHFRWPVLDAALLAGALRWLTLLLTAAGLLWLARAGARRAGRSADGKASAGAREE